MTNISSGVLTGVKWASRPGASYPRFSFLGTSVPAAGAGTGTSAVAVLAVPRVRGKVSFVAPPQANVASAQLGQVDHHNYMTRVYAVGEGASGPPRYREPA